MVGDYISTSWAGGTAHPVFPVASAPTAGGSDCATATPSCDQALYSPTAGLAPEGGHASADDPVVVSAPQTPGQPPFERRR
jgi:hypothetical protein